MGRSRIGCISRRRRHHVKQIKLCFSCKFLRSNMEEDTEFNQRWRPLLSNELHEENSIETLLQLSANYEKPKRGSAVRTVSSAAERRMVMQDPTIRRVCRMLRFLRKRKFFYRICLDLMNDSEFVKLYYENHAQAFFVDSTFPTGRLIDPNQIPQTSSSMAVKWFTDFIDACITPTGYQFRIPDDYEIVKSTMKGLPPTNVLEREVINKEKQLYAKYKHLAKNEHEDNSMRSPVDELIDLTNLACRDFARNHNLTFARLTAAGRKSKPMEASQVEATYDVESHNALISQVYKPPSKSKVAKALIRDTIIPNSVTEGGANVIPASVSMDMSRDLFSLKASENNDPESDFEAEEGWAEHAHEHLTKAGLDPTQYGLPPASSSSSSAAVEIPKMKKAKKPPTISDYGTRAKTKKSKRPDPVSPPDDDVGSTDTDYDYSTDEHPDTRKPTVEPPLVNAPTTPPVDYNDLAVNHHRHPIVDIHDIADAAEVAIDNYVASQEDPENFSGGEFLVPVEAVVEEINSVVFPTELPAHSVAAASTPPIVLPDDSPTHTATPPLIINDRATTHTAFPGAGGSPRSPTSPSSSSRTPPTAAVHSHSGYCEKWAVKFVDSWRAAKKKAYRHKRFRFFPINRTMFAHGNICHRCYQLVRAHHEHYHLKGGGVRDEAKLKYPRGRRSSQRRKIPPPDKHSRGYKKTSKMARKYTKEYEKLARGPPKKAYKYAAKHFRDAEARRQSRR